MSIPGRLRRMVSGRIRRFGGNLQVTLLERHTLKNQATGAALSALVVLGNHLAGVAVIDLSSPNLIGTLPKGAKVTISGTEYTTTAQTDAVGGVLVDVPISPVLAGNVAGGVAATITQVYGEWAFAAMRSQVTERDAMLGAPDGARVYKLAAAGHGRIPRKGDILVDGEYRDTVLELGRLSPSGTPIFHTVFVGSAS